MGISPWSCSSSSSPRLGRRRNHSARNTGERVVKVHDSGMPGEVYWESLFDVCGILSGLGIDSSLGDVAELGCGYGTFTLPVARTISGTLHTCDIDPAMIPRTRE